MLSKEYHRAPKTVAACILRPIYVDLEYIFGLRRSIAPLCSSARVAELSPASLSRSRVQRSNSVLVSSLSSSRLSRPHDSRSGSRDRESRESLSCLVTLISFTLGSLRRWGTLLLSVLLHAPSTKPHATPPCNGRPGAPPLSPHGSRLMRGPLVRSLRRRTRAAAAPVAHVAVQVLLDLRGEAV